MIPHSMNLTISVSVDAVYSHWSLVCIASPPASIQKIWLSVHSGGVGSRWTWLGCLQCEVFFLGSCASLYFVFRRIALVNWRRANANVHLGIKRVISYGLKYCGPTGIADFRCRHIGINDSSRTCEHRRETCAHSIPPAAGVPLESPIHQTFQG